MSLNDLRTGHRPDRGFAVALPPMPPISRIERINQAIVQINLAALQRPALA